MLGITPPGLHLPKQSANLPSGNASAHRNPGPTSSIGKLLQCIKNAAMAFKQALPHRTPSSEPKLLSFRTLPDTDSMPARFSVLPPAPSQPSGRSIQLHTQPDARVTPAAQNRTPVSVETLLKRALEAPDSPEEKQMALEYKAAAEDTVTNEKLHAKRCNALDEFVGRYDCKAEADIWKLPRYGTLACAIQHAFNDGDDILESQLQRKLDCFVEGHKLKKEQALRASPQYQALRKAMNDAEVAWDKARDAKDEALQSLASYWINRGEVLPPLLD